MMLIGVGMFGGGLRMARRRNRNVAGRPLS
jgi:hypothetical protein